MRSSESLQKHTGKGSSDEKKSAETEILDFDLFYQLTYLSATAAAGISRHRLFDLGRKLPSLSSHYFDKVYKLVENLRYNYPDACRMVGVGVKSENLRTFLLRFSDVLRSGEPIPAFLAREAQVQGESYINAYERQIESMKKWNDGYIAIAVSVALILIINMVSSMIYSIGTVGMVGMVVGAILMDFVVAWVLFRASPQEIKFVTLSEGAREQRLSLKLLAFLGPAAAASLLLVAWRVNWGWGLVLAGLVLAPVGMVSRVADEKITRKDAEITSFLRSLGGTASSRGTTLTDALANIRIDPFPTLQPDIRFLTLRLCALSRPELCWKKFGVETGSKLVSQTTDIFYEAISLGGDPENVGILSSLFAMRTAMLRAKRRGVAASFSWLIVVMHGVLVALKIFLLEILKAFSELLQGVMSSDQQQAVEGMSLFALGIPNTQFLTSLVIGVTLALSLANAFVIVASEGTHFIKIAFYLSLMLFVSGLGFLIVPLVMPNLALGL